MIQKMGHYGLSLAVAAFCLNWPWEMAQMRAYVEMARQSWQETVLPCTIATVGDVAITAAIYGIGALACADLRWAHGRWNAYLASALLGTACAAGIEWKSRLEGRWSYSPAMPVVPVLNAGLWPLLQLTLLVPLALGLAEWWSRSREPTTQV